jgi:hypothetical protein
VINLLKMIDADKLYEIALELYEDDYHEAAIKLFHEAMKRTSPTKHHLDCLETSQHILKTAFYRELRDRYPDSWQIKFSQANFLHGTFAIKLYSEVLENSDLGELDKRKIRYCRLRESCKQRNTDYDMLREDFFYLWNHSLELVPSISNMRRVILKTLTLDINSPHAIPLLKRLSEESELDEQARLILQSKINLLQLLDDFAPSE